MSKLQIGDPLKNFNPDISIIIQVESKTGQIKIESANGVPINPLLLASICCNIAKANVDNAIMQQTQAATQKGKLPHQFFALEGEHRCRIPGCGKIRNDAIHIAVEPVDETTVVQ